jgi:hypothetical protein
MYVSIVHFKEGEVTSLQYVGLCWSGGHRRYPKMGQADGKIIAAAGLIFEWVVFWRVTPPVVMDW